MDGRLFHPFAYMEDIYIYIYMKLRNVRKTYHNQNNDVEALKGISLDLNNNGITVILGSSGCGKTTLLNCIASKETYEGTIEDVPSFD